MKYWVRNDKRVGVLWIELGLREKGEVMEAEG